MVERLLRNLLLLLAHLLTGVRGLWASAPPQGPTIYFANHVSHADFVMLWAALPSVLRERTRPVAGADYWGRGRLRRYIGERVVRAVQNSWHPDGWLEDAPWRRLFRNARRWLA